MHIWDEFIICSRGVIHWSLHPFCRMKKTYALSFMWFISTSITVTHVYPTPKVGNFRILYSVPVVYLWSDKVFRSFKLGDSSENTIDGYLSTRNIFLIYWYTMTEITQEVTNISGVTFHTSIAYTCCDGLAQPLRENDEFHKFIPRSSESLCYIRWRKTQ